MPDAEDRIRPWLLLNTLKELHGLIKDGYDIRGYFHWTLADNFEWTEGWNLRFGLIAMDPTTQVRTMRPSGALYRGIALENGFSPEMVEEHFLKRGDVVGGFLRAQRFRRRRYDIALLLRLRLGIAPIVHSYYARQPSSTE